MNSPVWKLRSIPANVAALASRGRMGPVNLPRPRHAVVQCADERKLGLSDQHKRQHLDFGGQHATGGVPRFAGNVDVVHEQNSPPRAQVRNIGHQSRCRKARSVGCVTVIDCDYLQANTELMCHQGGGPPRRRPQFPPHRRSVLGTPTDAGGLRRPGRGVGSFTARIECPRETN
jgi:hypothetical protein